MKNYRGAPDSLLDLRTVHYMFVEGQRALEQQLAAYAGLYGDAELSLGLIDSAYLARDLRSERCRSFNA